MSSSSKIDTQFSGISVTSTYPPHNGLAVGPNNIVMVEGTRIEWTDLTGGAATPQSVFTFFQPLGASATNSLYDPRCIYDSASGRFIVIMENFGSNGAVSDIDFAISKDSNPNDGWYFASLNTSLTINGQLTASDRPSISVDANNIYITAAQYNVNIPGYAGTETWVIGKTAGAGGGLYNGGTMTVVASQLTAANQGIFTVAAASNGKTYYACDYATGGQIVVVLQTYDTAAKTFGPAATIALGNIDQGGAYTAQQQGTSLLLDAGDKRIQSLQYANGFLWGLCELMPVGSSVPQVHWFKIDVTNPNAPTLVAQGNISGASLGANVSTFNGSLAVDGAGDVMINFTASGPNMYPSDYYVFQAAADPLGSFSAPILYQASTGFFNAGNGASVQRWGAYSTTTTDINNPKAFWLSNEYVANNWWQTSVAEVEIKAANVPTIVSVMTTGTGITNGSGILTAGSTVTLTVNFSNTVTVNTGGGSPSLALNDGGTATYTGGSGTSALTFSYTVALGQNTPDLTINLLSLNGATITDGTTNNADLSAATNYNPAGTLQINTAPSGTFTSRIQSLFTGISDPTDDPPDNGLAVGPNNIVMAEGQRVGWTDLSGGTATTISAYSFFKPPGGATSWTGSLKDTSSAYDQVNNRYIFSTENLNPHTSPSSSYIAFAVSKDSNPNDGWYFGTINSSSILNSVATVSDEPSLAVDGTNIYIAAPQYNASGSGYQGSKFWVVSDRAGSGGGIYSGGTPTVIANQFASPNLGIFRDVAGNNGKSYFASAYNSNGQSRIALQIYDVATNTFGAMNSVVLGNIDQSSGGSTFFAQQKGSTVQLNVDDGRIGNLVYANGFLYGTNEIQPIGSSVPNVHWFKINVSNPASPVLVAQGNISGAAIGAGVATFNGSIAVDGAGDLIINFNASGPNMYPSDYYVVDKANDSTYTFSAPVLYQASSQPFVLDTNRWGANSSARADPSNPNSFWISSEYIANNWWQTAVAQIVVQNTPGLAIASIATSGAGITNGNGDLNAGKTVTLTVNFNNVAIVDTTNGTPTLTLSDGGIASFVQGSGSTAMTFSYTVASGQNTSDLLVSSFNLNGAVIKDGNNNKADLSASANYNPAGTLQIDTLAPAAPAGLSLDTTTDGGVKGDGITNFGLVKIDGTAEAGSTVTLYDTNGVTVLGTGTANGTTGVFSIITSALPDGVHRISAEATDAAGNIGAASSTYQITVDTVAPAPPTGLSLDATTDSGTLGDGTTNFTQVKIDGTAAPGSTVTLYDTDGVTVLGTGVANSATGAFGITTTTLAGGTHNITAKAVDVAGNASTPSASYAVTVTAAPTTSETDKLFSGISDLSTYPPHNALAVGPNYIVMAEGARIEWTNLAGGAPALQSVYQFFGSLGATATNALFDPRAVYDPINQRYVVTIDNVGSGGTISNIDIAVSKTSNPNDGWYLASLNTALTINGHATSADAPIVSVDGSNIYVTAPQYNNTGGGWQGTEVWVIGDKAGAGGGIYNGGTMTVVANEVTSSGQGIYRVVAGNNGKSYYASSYSTGSQIAVTLQIYDVATNTFGPVSTIGLGNIDQGGSYTAQQLGTSLLLDANDGRVQNLAYANGFLYGVTEEKPIGSSVPLVHWFKIDVSNPNSPTLVAQGDISGATLGSNVATFNGSIAVDATGDVLINFTASGPNMYPGDYYVLHAAGDSSNTFSAPTLYQASGSFFDSGNGSSVQRWGAYSTIIADPANPQSFWVSNEYVANGWWQTSVAQIEVQPLAEVPTLTVSNATLTVSAGGSVPLGVQVTPFDVDDAVSVTIGGLTSYETITDNLDQTVFSGSSVTLSAAEVNSGLSLQSSYAGSGHPVNNLTLIASNTRPGEAASSAAQTIVVTDPPAVVSSGTQSIPPTNPVVTTPESLGAVAPAGLAPSAYTTLAGLLDHYMAAGSRDDAPGICRWTAPQQAGLGGQEFLTKPAC